MTCGFIAAEACYTTPLLALCSSGRIHRHHGSIFHPQGDNRHEARCYTRDDGRPRAPLNGGGQPRTIPAGGRNPGAPGRVMANRMSDRRSELSETRPRSRTESRGRQRPPDQGGPSTGDRGAALAGESATGSVVQERDELAQAVRLGGPPGRSATASPGRVLPAPRLGELVKPRRGGRFCGRRVSFVQVAAATCSARSVAEPAGYGRQQGFHHLLICPCGCTLGCTCTGYGLDPDTGTNRAQRSRLCAFCLIEVER